MTNPDVPLAPMGHTKAAATAAAEAAASATAAAEDTAAGAEAAALAATARAASAAADAAVAEAAAAAAKSAARPTTNQFDAGRPAAPEALHDVKPMHVKASEWAGPDGFLQYQEDVKVWLHMTTLPDDKKGGAMRLALTGVAKEAARNVTVAQVISPTGHEMLLTCLRTIFAGSESQRGHDAYSALKTLYRGSRSMEEYLSAMGLAPIQCRVNGYSMSSKTAAAVVLDQAGLDANQKASTMAAAAVLSLRGKDTLNSLTMSLRDLWGGSAPLKPSPDAAMMVVTHGEHKAYVSRRSTPTTPRRSGGGEVYRGPAKTADPAGC